MDRFFGRIVGRADARGCDPIPRLGDLHESRRNAVLKLLSDEHFRLLVEAIKDYAIFLLDPKGSNDLVERRRAADQDTPRPRS
jgi:hypothetical protein